MPGTPTGIVDCYWTSVNNFTICADIYQRIFSALSAAPGTTLISHRTSALQRTDFFVFRFDANANRPWPWYLLVQANDSTFGHSLRIGGSYYSSGNVAWQAARGIGGDENPWLGTTNADGSDTKPTPWWGTPTGGTGVQVLPACNGVGGDEAANKDGGNFCAQLTTTGNIDARFSVVLNDDSIVTAWQLTSSSNYYYESTIGWVQPDARALGDGGGFLWMDGWHGGSPVPDQARNVDVAGVTDDPTTNLYESSQVAWTAPQLAFSSVHNPHNYIPGGAGGALIEHPAGIWDLQDGRQRYLGEVDPMVRFVYQGNLNPTDWNAAFTRATFGYPISANLRVSIPWHGGAAPETHGTSAGVAF